MNHTTPRLQMMRNIIMVGLLVFGSELYAISTTMNRRLVTSSPLLYKQVDYAHQALSFEIEPWVSGMFDPQHTMGNLGINGQSNMSLNQQGLGDINSELILLGTRTTANDYASVMTLQPELLMYGALLHFYKQFEYVFFDIKTAVLNCKTIIDITEFGGNNGGMQMPNGTPIYNAQGAFTQADWSYGKFGDSNDMTGIDNVQFTVGASGQIGSSISHPSFLAGFAIIEAPMGQGTTGEWLFEPQVGTNHWAFGAGLDYMLSSDSGYSLVLGGNYRYMLANWETRSFDLTVNGEWSRYLALQSIAGIPGPAVNGLPGINLFTQDALIHGRNEVTAYARLQKNFEGCLLELSYNYLYLQHETITDVTTIRTGYGIYDAGTVGGVDTASTATIAQRPTSGDASPVTLVNSDFNLESGAASNWMSNTFAARLQSRTDKYTCGIGASVDLAMSAQAISSWSVWFNLEILLPN